jgi:hypothetical protein
MDTESVENRIRLLASSTDNLIARLETLSGRLDTARANENQELAEYYERQFAEASVEFMNGVETILDEWYELKGTKRPPSDVEVIEPEVLEEIHNTVVSIVQRLPLPAAAPLVVPQPAAASVEVAIAAPVEETMTQVPAGQPEKRPGSGGKVDVKG